VRPGQAGGEALLLSLRCSGAIEQTLADSEEGVRDELRVPEQRAATPELRLVEQHEQQPMAGGGGLSADDTGTAALLEVVGRLVDRAREAGELRADVTVSDVLLVIATAAPSLPDAVQQEAASARLLDILLEGLRSRPV